MGMITLRAIDFSESQKRNLIFLKKIKINRNKMFVRTVQYVFERTKLRVLQKCGISSMIVVLVVG